MLGDKAGTFVTTLLALARWEPVVAVGATHAGFATRGLVLQAGTSGGIAGACAVAAHPLLLGEEIF